MTSKEAVKSAYTELQIQNIFEDDEEDNQWHKNVINGLKNAEKDLDKLEQLEDIEEELGIDLITLFKALTNGVWVKNEFGQTYHTNVHLYNLSLSYCLSKNTYCFITNGSIFLLFSALNQTWALTKEELEK